MFNLGPVVIGIVMIMVVKIFMPHNLIIGLIGIGFLVGYMVGDGPIMGLIASVLVGTVECVIGTFISVFTDYAGFQSFVIFDPFNFTLTADLTGFLFYLIYLCIVMGLSGAIGGFLNKKKF